ncbi:hypothetical protein VKT23_015093 [Stygiomarasmius scandens]|uniref:Uncharacterized protein n=1 Tax=Marasmiellus scandens TaxID=2682957 RepID=A0ABR1IYL2_9AGAR
MVPPAATVTLLPTLCMASASASMPPPVTVTASSIHMMSVPLPAPVATSTSLIQRDVASPTTPTSPTPTPLALLAAAASLSSANGNPNELIPGPSGSGINRHKMTQKPNITVPLGLQTSLDSQTEATSAAATGFFLPIVMTSSDQLCIPVAPLPAPSKDGSSDSTLPKPGRLMNRSLYLQEYTEEHGVISEKEFNKIWGKVPKETKELTRYVPPNFVLFMVLALEASTSAIRGS